MTHRPFPPPLSSPLANTFDQSIVCLLPPCNRVHARSSSPLAPAAPPPPHTHLRRAMLKQALSRARALVMAQAGPGLGLLGAAQHAGGAWEAAARTLSSLPSLRSFHHQSQAQQGAAAEAPGAPAEAQPRSQPLPPWTPTRDLQKRKVLTKRMAHLMQVLRRRTGTHCCCRWCSAGWGCLG